MASKYRKINPRIWYDETMSQLSTNAKLVAVYLLTSPEGNRIGCFPMSKAAAAEALGLEPKSFAKAFTEACDGLGWGWDQAARVLYIPTWWKYQSPDHINAFKGCLKDVQDVPKCSLLNDFLDNSEFLSESFADAKAKLSRPKPKLSVSKPKAFAPGTGTGTGTETETEKNPPTPLGGICVLFGGVENLNRKSGIQPPPELDNSEFESAWSLWTAHRKEIKKPLTATSIGQQLKALAKTGSDRAILTIENSIKNGWVGLFEPKESAAKHDNTPAL